MSSIADPFADLRRASAKCGPHSHQSQFSRRRLQVISSSLRGLSSANWCSTSGPAQGSLRSQRRAQGHPLLDFILHFPPWLMRRARTDALQTWDDIEWIEGDAENLPFPDRKFDVVVSQFGHMFALRPDVAVAQMRRVLKPDGRIAFATWPPEHLIGRMFALVVKYSPPLPPGAAPPPRMGQPDHRQRASRSRVRYPLFFRGVMQFPALSLSHYREFMERSVGPMQKVDRGHCQGARAPSLIAC